MLGRRRRLPRRSSGRSSMTGRCTSSPGAASQSSTSSSSRVTGSGECSDRRRETGRRETEERAARRGDLSGRGRREPSTAHRPTTRLSHSPHSKHLAGRTPTRAQTRTRPQTRDPLESAGLGLPRSELLQRATTTTTSQLVNLPTSTRPAEADGIPRLLPRPFHLRTYLFHPRRSLHATLGDHRCHPTRPPPSRRLPTRPPSSRHLPYSEHLSPSRRSPLQTRRSDLASACPSGNPRGRPHSTLRGSGRSCSSASPARDANRSRPTAPRPTRTCSTRRDRPCTRSRTRRRQSLHHRLGLHHRSIRRRS